MKSFEELGIDTRILDSLMKSKDEGGMGLAKPTSVQIASIPHFIKDNNILLKSETGSGKT